MARFFWPYFVIYAALVAASFVIDLDGPSRPILMALDTIVAVLGMVGMLIYRRSPDWRRFRPAWAAVFVFMAVELVTSMTIWTIDEAHEPGSGFLTLVLGVVLTILIELPNVVMNGRVAFSPAYRR